MMIIAIAKNIILAAMFWSFLSPLLNFAFYHYFVESDNRNERMAMTMVNGLGYAIGTGIVLLTTKYFGYVL
jgi:hypothetical protein